MEKLALIMDYHPNFYYTYLELSKHYKITMFGDSYYPVPKCINLVKWETKILGNIYVGNPKQLIKELKGFDVALIKDIQVKSLQAVNICKNIKLPYAMILQKVTKPYLLPFIRSVIGKNTPIICSVDVDYAKILSYFPDTSNIPFSIPVRKVKRNPRNKINILCVSKLDQPRKDHFTLLEALKYVDFDYNLTIVGSMKQFNEYACKLLLQPRITFKQDLTQKQLAKEYKKADLFILPAYNEPANYSILEAMSYGLPVICSDTNGSKCYLHWSSVFRSKDYMDLYLVISLIYINLIPAGKFNLRLVDEFHNPKYNTQLIVNKLRRLHK